MNRFVARRPVNGHRRRIAPCRKKEPSGGFAIATSTGRLVVVCLHTLAHRTGKRLVPFKKSSLFQVELGPHAGRCSCCGSSAGSCCGSPSGSSQHRCSSSRHDSPDSSLSSTGSGCAPKRPSSVRRRGSPHTATKTNRVPNRPNVGPPRESGARQEKHSTRLRLPSYRARELERI